MTPPKFPNRPAREKLASSDDATTQGAWWISTETTLSLLTAAALRDPQTGQPLPDSLSSILNRLHEALSSSNTPRQLPQDTFFRALELANLAMQAILLEPTTNLIRTHEMIPYHSAQEIDQKTIRWISTLPGRTIREKLASEPKIKAPIRRFCPNTQENRITRRLINAILDELHLRSSLQAPSKGAPQTEEVFELASHLCNTRLRQSPLFQVPPALELRPNNVLLDDRRYTRIWRALNLLEDREDIESQAWRNMPHQARHLIFLGLIARLIQHPQITLWDRPGLISAPNSPAPDSLTLHLWIVPSPTKSPQPAKSKTTNQPYQGKILTISLTDKGISAATGHLNSAGKTTPTYNEAPLDLPISIAPNQNLHPGRGAWASLPIQMLNSQVDQGQPLDFAGITQIITLIEAQLSSTLNLKASASQNHTARQPFTPSIVGLELSAPSPIAAGEEQTHTFDLRSYAIAHKTKQSHLWQVEHTSRPLLPPGGQDLLAGLTSIFQDDPPNKNDLLTGLRHIIHSLASTQELQKTKAVAFSIPDKASRDGIHHLHTTLKSLLRAPQVLPVWRSVAAATAWQTTAKRPPREGDLLVIIDIDGPELTITPLTARSDKDLRKRLPKTRGIFWERRPSLTGEDEDPLLTRHQLLENYATALLKTQSGQDDPKLTSYLVESGRIDDLIHNSSLVLPLPDTQDQWLAITHDRNLWRRTQKSWTDLFRARQQKLRRDPNLRALTKPNQQTSYLIAGDIPGLNLATNSPLQATPLSTTYIAQGLQNIAHRAQLDLPTWTDWTPIISVEIIKDGRYQSLPLLTETTAHHAHTGQPRTIRPQQALTLPKTADPIYLPLLTGEGGQELLPIQARLPQNPDAAQSAYLEFTFRSGIDDQWNLKLSSPNKTQTLRWTNTHTTTGSWQDPHLTPTFSTYQPQPPWSLQDTRELFKNIKETSHTNEDELKKHLWDIKDALSDGKGERADFLQQTLQLAREFRSTESFNAALFNALISGLGGALWRDPQLVFQIPIVDDSALDFLLSTSDQTLKNIASRAYQLLNEPPSGKRSIAIYTSPFINTCQLLLSLLRLRETSQLPQLTPTDPRIARMARYIRRFDHIIANDHDLRPHRDLSNLLSSQSLTRHPDLRQMSPVAYQTTYFLLGGLPPIPAIK